MIKSFADKHTQMLFERKRVLKWKHIANMIVLGINHSRQGLGLKPFTSRATNLKDEIKACERNLDNLISSSDSRVQGLISEIEEITQENNQESYGNWEARIEVDNRNLSSLWCKIQ